MIQMEILSCGIIGVVVLFICIKLFLPLLLVFYRYQTANWSFSNVKDLRSDSHNWAVVTGGTDGIGLAYAKHLAKFGFNICIISRSLEKLQAVAEDISQTFGVQTRVIQADFTKASNIYDTIREEVKGMGVAILVNNVGMTQQYPCPLIEHPTEDSFFVDFAHCNMTSAAMMSRLVLQQGGMRQRGRGLIINISSASALSPLPLGSMYCATKAFLDFFSRGLEVELRDSGVQVQTVLPFYVLTKFIGKFQPPSYLAPSADEYVSAALAMVGVESRTHGPLSHSIQGLLMLLPPAWFRNAFAARLQAKRAKIARGG